jgi:hypothetical protein
MNTNEQRIAIAEWMGWTGIHHSPYATWKPCAGANWGMLGKPKDGNPDIEIPNYPNSLDACADFEGKLLVGEQRYWIKLLEITDRDNGRTMDWRAFAHASAAQRCEALCRTLFPERWT